MRLVLMVLSLLATTVGVVAIAWGIFNQTFDNNALIVSGSISAGTGLALFALAAIVEQFSRISEGIERGTLDLRHFTHDGSNHYRRTAAAANVGARSERGHDAARPASPIPGAAADARASRDGAARYRGAR